MCLQNMVFIKSIFSVISLLFFISCKSNSIENKNLEKINSNQSNLNDWKKDSLGCQHLRNSDLIDRLISENSLMGKSQKDFTNVFGKPNEIKISGNQLFLVYFLNSICEEEKLTADSDKTKVRFKFIQNKLIESPSVFEVQ